MWGMGWRVGWEERRGNVGNGCRFGGEERRGNVGNVMESRLGGEEGQCGEWV